LKFLKEILIAKKNELGFIRTELENNGDAGYGKNPEVSRPEKRFIRNISRGRINIIAEIKKASPSKGIINIDLDVSETARTYNKFDSFISGLSVLTEPLYFKGDGRDVALAQEGNSLPVLRKDFIFNELQIYESARLGADCILLISSLLSARRLKELYKCAGELGLDVLVETHYYRELENAIDMGAGLIGINNRDLKKMKVDNEHIVGLLNKLPGSALKEIKLVCESGVNDLDYINRLYNMGVETFLIGTYFMQSPDLEDALDRTREGLAVRGLI